MAFEYASISTDISSTLPVSPEIMAQLLDISRNVGANRHMLLSGSGQLPAVASCLWNTRPNIFSGGCSLHERLGLLLGLP